MPDNKIVRPAVMACLLIVLTLVVFGPACRQDFALYDDGLYVTNNRIVQAGLTAKGLSWALTTSHASNWHPLTWASHMLDVSLYGLNPAGHHLTNLLFHAANAALLFLVLLRMTGAPWRSGFVAALFAVHPLHVESVAWVAERKDVLSTFFWLATVWAYLRYLERPRPARYLPVVGLFAVGLMAKPMLVTLPITLLLLDYWPLGRMNPPEGPTGVLREKIPLFALSLASAAITLAAQVKGASAVSLERIPAAARVSNAFVAAATYVLKTVWPSSLAIYYPHPGTGQAAWKIAGAALLVVAVTVLAVRRARKSPYLATGWFWYLATLVPVIGLVQVGSQSMADRYTYVPLIGLFIAVAWGVPEIVSRWRFKEPFLGISAGAVLCALAVTASVQLRHWRSDVALFSHAIEVTSGNWLAEMNLGVALDKLGRPEEAIAHYREAIRIRPDYAEAHYNLGVDMARKGRIDDAIAEYRRTLEIWPDYPYAHNNLGLALERQGKPDDAVAHYRAAIASLPTFALAYNNLGSALGSQGKFDEAMAQFLEAVRIAPNFVKAHYNMGILMARQGKNGEAAAHFREALRLAPGNPEIRVQLEAALAKTGK